MEHFSKILCFSDFIRKRIIKIFNLKVALPNYLINFLIKDYNRKRLYYFVYTGCVLIHINFEQFVICGFVLLRFFVKLLNNFFV